MHGFNLQRTVFDMTPANIPLDNFRLPDYPDVSINLDGHALSVCPEIADCGDLENEQKFVVPVGIATILYQWHPNALAALLDLDAWFSMTWSVTLPQPSAEGAVSKLEIGRVGNQITFGTLDSSGDNWEVMVTYNIVLEGEERGMWVPNVRESMLGERDTETPEEVKSWGENWVKDALANKRWEAAKGTKHSFHVEYAPMDIWGDGIPMSPHWLYAPPDLASCTSCERKEEDQCKLSRCARCGTAAYCSAACQKQDWKVHKWTCNMNLEDRGQAIKLTEKGGLIGWDTTKTMAEPGSKTPSQNPHFAQPQLKRFRAA